MPPPDTSTASTPRAFSSRAKATVSSIVMPSRGAVDRRHPHEQRPVGRPDGAHRLDHLEREPHPALERAAVLVGPPVGQRREELVQQVAVRGVQLDDVEAGGRAPAGPRRRTPRGPRPAPRRSARAASASPGPTGTVARRHRRPRRLARPGVLGGHRAAAVPGAPAAGLARRRARAGCRRAAPSACRKSAIRARPGMCSSDHRPTSPWLIRPVGRHAGRLDDAPARSRRGRTGPRWTRW